MSTRHLYELPLFGIDIGLVGRLTFADITASGKDPDAWFGEADGKIHFYKNYGFLDKPKFVQLESGGLFDGIKISSPAVVLWDANNDGLLDAVVGTGFVIRVSCVPFSCVYLFFLPR